MEFLWLIMSWVPGIVAQVAASLADNLVTSRVILIFGWLGVQTAAEDTGLVAVVCVLLRFGKLSGS